MTIYLIEKINNARNGIGPWAAYEREIDAERELANLQALNKNPDTEYLISALRFITHNNWTLTQPTKREIVDELTEGN